MTSEDFARLAEAVAALIWPILALAVVVALLPVLREIVRRRQFTIKVGSFELSAQAATDQLLTQIEDLQKKVVALEQAQGRSPLSDDLLDLPFGTAEQTRNEASPARGAAAARRILWVDDRPENNATLIAALQSEGIEVETVPDSREAVAWLWSDPDHFAALITDQGRVEDGRYKSDAGTALIRELRGGKIDVPIAVYTTARGVRMRGEALQAGAEIVTSSPTEVRAFVAKHTGRAADAD